MHAWQQQGRQRQGVPAHVPLQQRLPGDGRTAAITTIWSLTRRPRLPARPQPKVAVIQIGANDFTNCAWSATDPKQKQKALDKELPGIFGR